MPPNMDQVVRDTEGSVPAMKKGASNSHDLGAAAIKGPRRSGEKMRPMQQQKAQRKMGRSSYYCITAVLFFQTRFHNIEPA